MIFPMESVDLGGEEQGVVFNIQRFSLHDGPGIRTTVFMKGCPLKCLWCSNPESQDAFPNLLVRDIQCKGCGACEKTCPRGAIRMTQAGLREIDWHKCDQCLACVGVCIYGSLSACGAAMRLPDVVQEVMRDEPFYRNSGGGVTVSGGEPLLQADFVAALLRELKTRGIHTAVDTSGYVAWSRVERVLPYLDLILFDVKHLDAGRHVWATGVRNGLILENLRKACLAAKVWLRLPLIAGFNDGEEHIRRIAALGKEMAVEKISLLPYHEGGKSKCEQLGRPYPFSNGVMLSEERVRLLKGIMEAEDVKVSVGS